MTNEKFRAMNKIANQHGYDIQGGTWADGCYDIYKMDDCSRPEIADATEKDVEKFIEKLEDLKITEAELLKRLRK